MTGTERAFNSWLSMMRRCFLSSDSSFKNYGGRGITVCERWYDWRNFIADMGERQEDLSLDRIDHEGIYEPGNCRWANATAQNRNTRHNVTVHVDGEPMLACDAALKYEVLPSTISRRRKAGFPILERRPLKLTAANVAQIKAEIRVGRSHASIAKEFDVTRQHISSIHSGKVWSWIE